MKFNECINQYMDMLGCSAKELADISHISPAVLSRYRSGEREPSPESEQIQYLARGIVLLSKKD